MKLSYKALVATNARAQETNVDLHADVNVTATTPPMTPPPAPPKGRAATIKSNIETRIEQNKDTRNTLLQKVEVRKELASTTKGIRMEARGEIKDMRDAHASSTEMFKRDAKDMRKDIAKKMEARMFEARKNALVKELNLSLANLTDVSTRISTRITKAESEGRTMTEAKTLLTAAGQKLDRAKIEVAAFAALNATSTPSGAATTTAEVDLTRPRVAGDAAIKSVKDARDAYQKVVVAIAHAMGVKVETHASTTVTTN
jgi:hypothetical protein